MEGFRHLRTNPTIATAVCLLLVMGLGGWAYQSQLSAFVVTRLGLGATGYGWLLAVNGLGACTAAIVVAVQGARLVRTRTLYTGALIYSAFIILFGAMHQARALPPCSSSSPASAWSSSSPSATASSRPNPPTTCAAASWASGPWSSAAACPSAAFGWDGAASPHQLRGMALQMGGVFCLVGVLAVYLFFRGLSA